MTPNINTHSLQLHSEIDEVIIDKYTLAQFINDEGDINSVSKLKQTGLVIRQSLKFRC